MFPGGATIVVGVSGGPDSTALLHVLGRLRMDARLVVAHVDHGLSGASEAIAADVARRAAEAGFDVHVARARGLEGPNLHARARDFRYSFFETIARQEEADAIATGHTLDDRVETTLQRLIRGAGSRGLAGIPYVGARSDGVRRVRPLLDVRRAETRAYCEEIGLEFVDDPGNVDLRFDRAAVRELVLGAIEERWGEGAIRAMATSIDRLAEDDRALQDQATLLYEGSAEAPDEGGPVSLGLAMMRELPPALQRRLLELAVGPLRDRGPGIDEVVTALGAPDASVGSRFDLAEGTRVVIDRDAVTVTRPEGRASGASAP